MFGVIFAISLHLVLFCDVLSFKSQTFLNNYEKQRLSFLSVFKSRQLKVWPNRVEFASIR